MIIGCNKIGHLLKKEEMPSCESAVSHFATSTLACNAVVFQIVTMRIPTYTKYPEHGFNVHTAITKVQHMLDI